MDRFMLERTRFLRVRIKQVMDEYNTITDEFLINVVLKDIASAIEFSLRDLIHIHKDEYRPYYDFEHYINKLRSTYKDFNWFQYIESKEAKLKVWRAVNLQDHAAGTNKDIYEAWEASTSLFELLRTAGATYAVNVERIKTVIVEKEIDIDPRKAEDIYWLLSPAQMSEDAIEDAVRAAAATSL